MPLVDLGASPDSRSYSLSQLQQWVRGVEAALGPITMIGNDGDETAGTFDNNNPENPSSPILSVVTLSSGGAAPSGAEKLCDGYAFVSGHVQRVVVFRPRA